MSTLKKLGYAVAGYTDPEDRGVLLGMAYLGTDDVLTELVRQGTATRAVLGVGKVDASDARSHLAARVKALGFALPSVVSPQAIVNEEVELGEGAVVFDGAVVNSGTVVGRLCIINTNSTVEHDCRLGENVHVASGATVSGGVAIGDHCLIGAGATLIQGVSVCRGCLIGAGATITKDLLVPGTYAGNPGRRIGGRP